MAERDRVGIAREHRQPRDRPRRAPVGERGHRRLETRAGFGDPALEEPLDTDAARDLGVELGVASPVQAGERLGRLAQLTVDEVVGPHRGGRGHDVDAGADAFTQLQTAPVVDGRVRCAESLHAHVAAPADDPHGELRPVARRPVGRGQDEVEGAIEVPDRFGVGGRGLRAGRGDDVVLDGLVGHSACVEVLRDQARVGVRTVHQRLGHTTMRVEALSLLLRLVGGVADERVHEPVGERRRHARDGFDDPGVGELRQAGRQLPSTHARDRAQQLDVDLAPDDGGDLRHALVVAERVEARRSGDHGSCVGSRRRR